MLFNDHGLLFVGSRAMTLLSYGFIALDLLSIIPEDAGEYTCRVTSSSGTAQSSAILVVTGIVVESILNKIIWRFLMRNIIM